MNNKLVVIGSNSFSGSHIVNYALNKGYRVLGISRSPELHPVFLPYKRLDVVDFTFYQYDLNNNIDQIMEVIDRFKPNIIINFAAQGMVAESWQNPEHWFRTNVTAQIRLHDRLRGVSYLEKYVHVSTPEVYGNCKGYIKENNNYNPSTPYAVSKASADMNLLCFYKAYSFPVTFTRSVNVYGPGQQLYRIIPRTILYFLLKKKLLLHGGGHSHRSFIHIEDVADATMKVAEKGITGSIYHIATDQIVSIRSLVKMIAEQMKIPFDDYVIDTGDRMGKDDAYLLDSTKIRETLNWKATISLEKGLEDTIAWVNDHFELLQQQPLEYIHKE